MYSPAAAVHVDIVLLSLSLISLIMYYKAILLLSVVLIHQVLSLLCCRYGTVSELPGQSCLDIIHLSPGCRDRSGMYWIERSNGSNVQVYCDMVSLGGGWERILHYNSSSTNNSTCPNNMYTLNVKTNNNNNNSNERRSYINLCTTNNSNITSTSPLYPITTSYSQVMGLMTAYISQPGQGFYPDGRENYTNLNTLYSEGLSLVINDTNTGTLKHVHTVTVTDLYNQNPSQSCFPYKHSSLPQAIIGRDNTCNIATQIHYLNHTNGSYSIGTYTSTFGGANEGICENFAIFCQSPSRYFKKDIPLMLNSSINPLLVRIMSRPNVTIGINFIDIYVR